MNEPTCPTCEQPITPGQPRISWFTKNDCGHTTERGAIHLNCVTRPPQQ